ncbi:MAG: SDR family oxidoreductase [Streptomycetaceae bacterium]|nr:SDR family oxidoreductase [Streptomycetaceae bacterium]
MRDKVVVVTGGASGIGRASAERLVAEGAAVVVADVHEDAAAKVAAEIRDAGGTAESFAADVTDAAACDDLARYAAERFGRIDVLVAAAGISSAAVGGTGEHDGTDAGLAFSTEVWQRVIDVNLNGLMYTNRAVARHMIPAGGGSIVNIASICSVWTSGNATPYAVSKAAAWMLTKSLAVELAPHGIRVNAVGPGFIETPMTAATRADRAAAEAVTGRTLMGRFGRPREVADTVLFLAGDESSYFTGSILYPDGGFNAPTR